MTEKRYNVHFKKYIELNEGEKFCLKCSGKGIVPKPAGTTIGKNATILLTCSKCYGEGKIDWVESIVGKKRKSNIIINNSFDMWQR